MNYPVLQTDINCDNPVKIENTNLLNNYRNVIIFPDKVNFLFNPFDSINIAEVSKLKFSNANNIIIYEPSKQSSLINLIDSTDISGTTTTATTQTIATLEVAEANARVRIWNTYDNCDYITLQVIGLVTSKTETVSFNNTIYLI